ncbi:hypothetical protein [Microbacterium deminutum]|uniref:Uncharacterized protein n=1 Tax=Microbacterium deminutum TaxID=344164 RepID=A0ABP5CVY5_9MICO
MMDREAPELQTPAFVPSLLISLAGRVLPGGSRRDRYRQEFLAELYGMTPARQTAHALQIVASSWSLRSATSHPQREGKTILTILRSKPLLCLLNIRHHWEVQSTPDGERYQRCTKCGKDRMEYPWGPDPKRSAPIGGVG